jgi:monofunctional biosynthetic peptidoglycan transglycosylase
MRLRPSSKRMKRAGRWALGAAALLFAYLSYAYITLPDVRPLAKTNPATTAFMELRDREAVAAGRTARRVHRWVRYGGVSPHVKRAVLVAEDAGFWGHDGVDYAELQKTLEVAELGWGLFEIRGASTITQQLAKNLYLSPSRNPMRKLRELIITRRLERELSKARIFEIYLNVIEWGDGIYGIGAAANAYYRVPASDLGPSQSALLAGAIINPRLLNPARPTARLLRRQQLILRRMGVAEASSPDTTSSGGRVPRRFAAAVAQLKMREFPNKIRPFSLKRCAAFIKLHPVHGNQHHTTASGDRVQHSRMNFDVCNSADDV